VSAQISEQTSQFYVGTLNGVMYRIRPGAMTPGGKLFALEPFEAPSSRTLLTPVGRVEAPPASVAGRSAAQPDAAAPALETARETATTDVAGETGAPSLMAERVTAAATLFKREGAEPLRAGHPDLWALLVRGTSLEGTSFQAASAS
jgi:hypothetical protein